MVDSFFWPLFLLCQTLISTLNSIPSYHPNRNLRRNLHPHLRRRRCSLKFHSTKTGSLVLACPGLHKGQIRVEHYALKKTKFISAHDSRIACFALTLDGQLIATASTKGTLIRIFDADKWQATSRRVLPKYFNSKWSVAQSRLQEGSHYTVAFGLQRNTVIILDMDGSFYRCQFDPEHGGEMTQLEYQNFLKPETALSRTHGAPAFSG